MTRARLGGALMYLLLVGVIWMGIDQKWDPTQIVIGSAAVAAVIAWTYYRTR